MPISIVDIPRISESIKALIRALENPPADFPHVPVLTACDALRELSVDAAAVSASMLNLEAKAALEQLIPFLSTRPGYFPGHHLLNNRNAAILDLLDVLRAVEASGRPPASVGQVAASAPDRNIDQSPTETQGSEGGTQPAAPARPRIPREEAERRVAAVIKNTPLDQRDKLTVRSLRQATGVSIGMVPSLDSWRELLDERAGSVRAVQFTDAMRAVLPDRSADAVDPAEAAANAEVLSELLSLANTDTERGRYEEMTPGERWQMLDQLKAQNADARRDDRRANRERPDCS